MLFPPRHHLGGETPTTTPNRYAAAVATSTVTVRQRNEPGSAAVVESVHPVGASSPGLEDEPSSASVATSTVTVRQDDEPSSAAVASSTVTVRQEDEPSSAAVVVSVGAGAVVVLSNGRRLQLSPCRHTRCACRGVKVS